LIFLGNSMSKGGLMPARSRRIGSARVIAATLVIAALTVGGGIRAQQPTAQKKPITHDVYDSWKSIQGTKLSRDGVWLAYALTPQDGDGELVVRNLKTNAEFRAPRGRDPIITHDGQFVVFGIAPLKRDVDRARRQEQVRQRRGGRGGQGQTGQSQPGQGRAGAPPGGVGIMELATGRVTTAAERVTSFRVPEESSRYVVFLMAPPEKRGATGSKAQESGAEESATDASPVRGKRKEPGTDLVIRELATGGQTTINEVAEYAVSKDGSWMAYSVFSTTPARDGAFARRIADGATRALLTGEGEYKRFVFDGKSSELAFLGDRDDHKSRAPRYSLYYWTTAAASATELSLPAGAIMPVSENGRLEFSKDGMRLFFGTAPPAQADAENPEPGPNSERGTENPEPGMNPEPGTQNPEPARVDIWNYKDAELQPMQKVRANEEKTRTYRAAFQLPDKRFVQLATPDMPELRANDGNLRALGISNLPYRQLQSWDGQYDDYFLVRLADGARRKVLEKERFGATLSPGGNYVLYFDADDDDWHVIRAGDGQRTNLTHGLGVKFQSETADTPDSPRPYGQAGWTEHDRSVLLYDRYDIWEVQPDGTGAHMITGGLGRREQIVFRYLRAEPAAQGELEEGAVQRRQPEEPVISTARPLLLSAVDERTKASGLYRVTLSGGGQGTGARGVDTRGGAPRGAEGPSKVVMLDKAFGVPLKAKDADVYVFTLSRFDEFPDLWASSGAFTDMKKVSAANPQQAEYTWGRSELVDYVNADGKPLRAILTKPEDFDPSKKYPLLVYIYEQLTQNLHSYVPPAPGTSINITRYVSNGYLVLRPDIVYEVGYPGQSALKCVIPAVEKVVSMGFIDSKRIGIQGHSWGGYQITYMITQTNIFRAVEAGASVSDMVSAYGGIRWGTGMSRAFQYEKTQSRIGPPPWKEPQLYIENSPIFWVERIHTPYLTIANDEDDAVPWYQGIEFFTAMRHLGKEAYMFVYNGEKHGLRQRENQKHWTVHLAEYFDHFLKDAPEPDWMTKGVPYLERGKRDVSGFFKSPTEDRKP
jgi:dienelactone hydrolase